jgi:hypothetical protein
VKRVLLDHMLTHKLAVFLESRYLVAEAFRRGWAEIKNGDLLREAEAAGFDVFLTADKNIGFQQNLSNRKIGIVELGSQRWDDLEAYLERVIGAIDDANPGSFTQVKIPLPPKRRG